MVGIKRDRMTQIKSILKRAFDINRKVSKEKLIAVLSVDFGFAHRTANDYLNDIIKAGYCIERQGILMPNATREADQFLLPLIKDEKEERDKGDTKHISSEER